MRIGVVGAGFSGTAIAANLEQQATKPLDIILFDKSGEFGVGPAYRTPYPYHLLNVRAKDMSAFTHDAAHFVNWLCTNGHDQVFSDANLTLAEQFVPRCLYREYLQSLLAAKSKNPHVRISFSANEVVDIRVADNATTLILANGHEEIVDKVVFALGNSPAATFPFPVADDIAALANPWDYQAVSQIPATDPVLIVGSGLSMIDAVLTLNHRAHQGPIYVVSRHGLLPLPHTNHVGAVSFAAHELPTTVRALMRLLRTESLAQIKAGGDWRAVIQGFRLCLPEIWQRSSDHDRKRFLQHLLPYWNIHRHRVHEKIMAVLDQLQALGQMKVLKGHVLQVGQRQAMIKPRGKQEQITIPCHWLINCMGPSLQFSNQKLPLIQALLSTGLAKLDSLKLGFAANASCALFNANGEASKNHYVIGPPTKGVTWEIGAVPEIRQQVSVIVQQLLA